MKTPTKTEIENVLELFAIAQEHGDASNADIDNAPFLAAEKLGWDWENDTDFTDWALKATQLEIAKEGRYRFITWLNRCISLEVLNDRLKAKGFAPLDDEQEAIFLSFSHEVGEERANMIEDIEGRVLGNA